MNAAAGTEEVEFRSFSGYLALLVAFLALVAIPILITKAPYDAYNERELPLLPVLGCVLLFVFMVKGMYMLQPNQSALLLLFG